MGLVIPCTMPTKCGCACTRQNTVTLASRGPVILKALGLPPASPSVTSKCERSPTQRVVTMHRFPRGQRNHTVHPCDLGWTSFVYLPYYHRVSSVLPVRFKMWTVWGETEFFLCLFCFNLSHVSWKIKDSDPGRSGRLFHDAPILNVSYGI